MKELSTEEKARRYDEAIERVKNIKTGKYETTFIFTEGLFEHIFPELEESEDERIRKQIISFLKEFEYDHYRCLDFSSWIDWLEKQGEQRPTIFIPKFRVGDKLVSTKNPRLTYEVLEVGHINELGNPDYKVEIFTDGKGSNPRNIHDIECHKVDEWAKLIEQKPTNKVEPKFKVGDWVILQIGKMVIWKAGNLSPALRITNVDIDKKLYWFNDSSYLPIVDEECLHLWTIEDAKDGDVLAFNDGHGNDCIELIKSITDKTIVFAFCLTNGNSYEVFDGITPYTNFASRREAMPATKEQRDLLFAKMKEAGYEWDAETKELKKIEQTIEIPFGAKDSELQEATYHIPRGYHAEINGNEVVIKKDKQKSL